MSHLSPFDTFDGEDTRLLSFTQECGLFAQRRRYGDTQHHFIHTFSQLVGSGIKIKFNLWLPIFLENMRCIRRFKGNVFGIDALNLESHFCVVLF